MASGPQSMASRPRSAARFLSGRARLLLCTAVGVSVLAAAQAGGPAAAASPQGTRPVDVLYAGSLVNMMELAIGPAYDRATGYTFNGFASGSSALVSDIKGGTQQADVFISASPGLNADLMGRANGNRVSWYAEFATSPL